ncbi:hypothetical protein B0H16DRAFT_1702286 [Mycena metata]|uniref:Uncharacterized protein n=1 Tax=Mycena metata TaxID=1033252 RepID=A0AAD7H7A0_9AGAR|nr:hypothetical protein B0H16DRAFT_1702286 [Mycena metata]
MSQAYRTPLPELRVPSPSSSVSHPLQYLSTRTFLLSQLRSQILKHSILQVRVRKNDTGSQVKKGRCSGEGARGIRGHNNGRSLFCNISRHLHSLAASRQPRALPAAGPGNAQNAEMTMGGRGRDGRAPAWSAWVGAEGISGRREETPVSFTSSFISIPSLAVAVPVYSRTPAASTKCAVPVIWTQRAHPSEYARCEWFIVTRASFGLQMGADQNWWAFWGRMEGTSTSGEQNFVTTWIPPHAWSSSLGHIVFSRPRECMPRILVVNGPVERAKEGLLRSVMGPLRIQSPQLHNKEALRSDRRGN